MTKKIMYTTYNNEDAKLAFDDVKAFVLANPDVTTTWRGIHFNARYNTNTIGRGDVVDWYGYNVDDAQRTMDTIENYIDSGVGPDGRNIYESYCFIVSRDF